MIEVVVCATGMQRHAPTLQAGVSGAGGVLSTVECFDRCEACERFLLCRIDGATLRFHGPNELLAALSTLGAEE